MRPRCLLHVLYVCTAIALAGEILMVPGKIAAQTARPEAERSMAASWQIEDIDGGMVGRNYGRWLRIDASDRPHLVYGMLHLRAAHREGAIWHNETVDGSHLLDGDGAMTLDPAGRAHIAYHDAWDHDLRYAYEDAAGWHIEVIDSEGDVGQWADIGLDPNGYPHISYYDATHQHLKVAYRDAAGWHTTTVDGAMGVGKYTSLAVAPTPPYAVHVVYYDEAHQRYKHARWTGSAWDIAIVDTGISSSSRCSLAVDGSGRPHVAYQAGGAVKYAFQDASGWHTTTVEAPGSVTAPSLDLERTSPYTPHIAYGNPQGKVVRYARKNASQWAIATVTDDFRGGSVALALDSSGQPHIAYDRSNQEIYYASPSGVTWNSQLTIRTGGRAGRWAHMAWSKNGRPHAIYFTDNSPHEYRYAYRDATGWHVERLNVTGQLGVHNAIAVDAAGRPHVVFDNDIEGANTLRYGYRDDAGWHYEDLPLADVKYPSLAIDRSGYPHISYTRGNYTFLGLFHTYKDAAGWHHETVEDGYVGSYTSLVLDAAGRAHISYADESEKDLKYAYQDAAGWHTTLVDRFWNVGLWTSLALDAAGYAHISYADASRKNLKYAYQDAAGWHRVTVDATDDVGLYTSLALDGAGHPHISYYDSTHGDLKYAYQDATGWHFEVPDSYPNYYRVGVYTSLYLDDDGRPHIGYYDDHAGIIKYAYRSESPGNGFHVYLPAIAK
ncbi:MAG: hypothetical protein GXP39_19955 [Chloroflexi bacterium]|nr:hypothetical protein [Chloroflexota bacterium]